MTTGALVRIGPALQRTLDGRDVPIPDVDTGALGTVETVEDGRALVRVARKGTALWISLARLAPFQAPPSQLALF